MRQIASALAVLAIARTAAAGPPYVTDDPEPVDYRNWEIYLASQTFDDTDEGWTGTAPHMEVNYGAAPNLQLHLILPLAFAVPISGPGAYGLGDTEIGFKLRFLEERKYTPMIGTFPLLEAPTGDRSAGLGNGSTQIFLPVWLQKSFGAWTMYGGAGAWIDLGDRDRHWWFFGFHLERRLFKWLTVGGEIFDLTPDETDAPNDARFDLGAVLDFGEHHHLMFSVGRGFYGTNLFQSYVAWQITFGPDAKR